MFVCAYCSMEVSHRVNVCLCLCGKTLMLLRKELLFLLDPMEFMKNSLIYLFAFFYLVVEIYVLVHVHGKTRL